MFENEVNEQDLLKKGRILALKIFSESFLISQGNEKTEEMFKDRKIDEQTEISNEESYVLHHWLLQEYREMGLDLNKIIEVKGESIEEGKLSKYELKEIVRRADKMLLQLSVFKKYLEANQEKENNELN